MRIHTSLPATATKRPVRQQPTPQPQNPENLTGWQNAAKPKPKTVPTKPPTQTLPPPGLYNDSRFGTRPLAPSVSGTPRPTLAPGAPGTTPPPNFGRPAPAAWNLALTLVSQG